MRGIDWLQLLLMLGVIVLVTKPLGIYFVHMLDPQVEGGTMLERLFGPMERMLYESAAWITARTRTGSSTPSAMLIFSCVTMLATYGLLRLQGFCR